jgi:hypothetical protein
MKPHPGRLSGNYLYNIIIFLFNKMSCSSYNEIISGCTYSSVAADGVIVGPRIGNEFRFYGLIEGPGIDITQTANVVGIRTAADREPIGKFVNMGPDVNVSGTVNYFPTLNASGLGQYDRIGNTIPITTIYTVSFLVNYIGTRIQVVLYDPSTNATLFSVENQFTNTLSRVSSVSSTRNVSLVAGQQVAVRILIESTNGQLLLSNSYLTISTA